MKRKVLSLLLVVAMAVSLFSACGGNNGDTNNNRDENKVVDSNNSGKTELGLQTCEFPACVEGQKGTITYNGDFVEVSNSDKINGADFDVKVKDENKTYTIGVTLSVESNGADEEIKSNKDWMETKAKSFQISEIKETTINKIPVQYYSCVYSTDGEHENKFFNCFIKFPTIEEYYNYTVLLRIDGNKEDALILSALENLLVDIELIGVKPVGVENETTEIKNDEFDEYAYYENWLSTASGKNVKIYLDKQVDLNGYADAENCSQFEIITADGRKAIFTVSDAATDEEYINNWLQVNDDDKIGTQEEIQMAGRTIHAYHLVDKETSNETISIGVIELASNVVFTFVYSHVKLSESELADVLGALRFVVE